MLYQVPQDIPHSRNKMKNYFKIRTLDKWKLAIPPSELTYAAFRPHLRVPCYAQARQYVATSFVLSRQRN